MTTILYHNNEVLADSKALELISGAGGAGMFVKGKKIFSNDKVIVTFFDKIPREETEEEVLRLSEWVFRYIYGIISHSKKLKGDNDAFKRYLNKFIFNSIFTNNIENLIRLKQGKYKFGDEINSVILIFTKNHMLSIGSQTEVIDKYKDEERIGKGVGISLDANLDEDGDTVLIDNPVNIGLYDLDDIDYLFNGTGSTYITSSIKLGMSPKQGFELAVMLDNVSSCSFTGNKTMSHKTANLKVLKPFSKKDLENIRKLVIEGTEK